MVVRESAVALAGGRASDADDEGGLGHCIYFVRARVATIATNDRWCNASRTPKKEVSEIRPLSRSAFSWPRIDATIPTKTATKRAARAGAISHDESSCTVVRVRVSPQSSKSNRTWRIVCS